MRQREKYLAAILAVSLFLTSCGGAAGQSGPELQEPVSRNSTYQPVETGSIGQTEALMATVMPKEYAHFYKSDVIIEEIAVEVGAYVKKGDILARADTREARLQKEELEGELAQEKKTFSLKEKISGEKLKEVREAGGRSVRKETALLKEDARYERQLYEQRVSDLGKAIKAEEKKISQGLLRARHAGYVTFRKNLAQGVAATSDENIIVVADRKDLYLEPAGQRVGDFKYKKYKVKYIYSNGKRYSVKEIPYRQSEMALAERTGQYPAVRLTCPAGAGLSAGDTCLVYFRKKEEQKVLVVSNDCLHTQGEEYFVYVKNERGEEEKRIVTVGSKDDYRTEIRSGLKKGELVSYSSSAALPVNYNTQTVTWSDFEIRSKTGSCRSADASPYVQLAKKEGLIVKGAVSDGDKVKKGDLICVVDTGVTKASLTELSLQIQKEKDSFRETMKGLKGKYEKELAEYTHNCTMKQLQKQYEEANEGNDGTGKVKIYAEYSGTVAACQIATGEQISVGTPLLVIQRNNKMRLLVFQIPPGSGKMSELEMRLGDMKKRLANTGETITFMLKGKKYKGTCTGYAVYGESSVRIPDRRYMTTEGGKSYFSSNQPSGFKYPGYYAELENEEVLKKLSDIPEVTYAWVSLKDVLTVPAEWVHEDNRAGEESSYYVWRVAEGELVRQYVTLATELNDGTDQVIYSGLEAGDIIAG